MTSLHLKERVVSSVLLLLSVVYACGCIRLKIGTASNPGPGMVPWVIAVLFFIFSSTYWIRSFFSSHAKTTAIADTIEAEADYRASLGIAACVMLFPALLYALKFLAATTITVFWILTLLKHKGVWASLAVSILAAVISFVIFSILLGVVLPGGVLEMHLLGLW